MTPTSRPPTFAAKYAVAVPALLLAASTYLAIERLASRASFHERDFSLAVDERVPFMPWTVWLYMPVWIAFFHLAVAFAKSWSTFLRGVATVGVVSVLAYAIFLAFPASYPRPPIDPGGSAALVLLSWIRMIDLPNNTFPSLHVAISFSVALAIRREDRERGAFMLLLALIPSLATVTVKQHFVADVAGGAVLAVVGHFIVYTLADPLADLLAGPLARVRARYSRYPIERCLL